MELNSYDLSRNFFNWCFENPEKITPTHIAMYFFIIEHCNRLGWKEKFGLPTTMVKDAIGIRNFRTYTKTLHDLVEWGFIKIIEVSKNQYSSNIIAIVHNAKANTKALDKALQKHSQKQVKSIDSILKQKTIEQETIKQLSWRNNFEKYKEELNIAVNLLLHDREWIAEREKFHPNLDIKLSMEKAYTDFWCTEAGWKYKKKTKSNEINWKSTFNSAIGMNKVYKQFNNNQNADGRRNISEINHSTAKKLADI